MFFIIAFLIFLRLGETTIADAKSMAETITIEVPIEKALYIDTAYFLFCERRFYYKTRTIKK